MKLNDKPTKAQPMKPITEMLQYKRDCQLPSGLDKTSSLSHFFFSPVLPFCALSG